MSKQRPTKYHGIRTVNKYHHSNTCLHNKQRSGSLTFKMIYILSWGCSLRDDIKVKKYSIYILLTPKRIKVLVLQCLPTVVRNRSFISWLPKKKKMYFSIRSPQKGPKNLVYLLPKQKGQNMPFTCYFPQKRKLNIEISFISNKA